jgi:predicted ABC-type ATPase
MRHNCIKNQQNFIFKEERIKIQTLKGGHTVPAEKIKSRYSKSVDNCSKVINLVDRAYTYDNSENSELLFRTVKNISNCGFT